MCRQNDLKQTEVEGWIQSFMDGGKQNLKSTAKDRQDEHEKEIMTLRAKVGELVLEVEARKKYQALLDQDETSY